MPIPPFNELKELTVQALGNLGGSARNQEILDEVARLGGVTEDEQNQTNPDGRPTFKNRLATARTYLRQGGRIVNSAEGVWALASGGAGADQREAESAPPAPAIQTIQPPQTGPSETAVEKPAPAVEEDAEIADEEGDWKQKLLATLKEMDPYAFERLGQRLLRESGFESVKVTQRSGDGGIDGVGVLQVNLVTFRVVFQCKRWDSSVGAPEIQKFRGAMQQGDKGLFITTGVFTRGSRDMASSDPSRSIDLVDGDRLCDLLKDLNLGVSTEMVERVNIDRNWFFSV